MTFKPGSRVQIQDRDREPANYSYATIVRACARADFFGGGFMAGDPITGYVVRYDNGCEVWHAEYDVVDVRPIKASGLRKGDLLQIGNYNSYVLVFDAEEVDGRILVTLYSGDQPNENGWTLAYDPDNRVTLNARNLGPNEPIAKV